MSQLQMSQLPTYEQVMNSGVYNKFRLIDNQVVHKDANEHVYCSVNPVTKKVTWKLYPVKFNTILEVIDFLAPQEQLNLSKVLARNYQYKGHKMIGFSFDHSEIPNFVYCLCDWNLNVSYIRPDITTSDLRVICDELDHTKSNDDKDDGHT